LTVPKVNTVTFAVTAGMLGNRLAVITAVPTVMLVTGTTTVLAPCVNVAVAGTVATAVLLELRLIVTPPEGAFTDKVSVRFAEPRPLMVKLVGDGVTVAVTDAVWLPVVYTGEEAVMVTEPIFTPVT